MFEQTSHFGVAHGFAVCMTLSPVAERNNSAMNCSDLLSLFTPWGGIQSWLDQVSGDIARLRLSSFGIEKAAIETIVKNTFTTGRMDNNPVLFTEDIVTDILEAIYE